MAFICSLFKRLLFSAAATYREEKDPHFSKNIATISYTIKKKMHVLLFVFSLTRERLFSRISTWARSSPMILVLSHSRSLPQKKKREQFMDNKIPLMDATRPEFIHPPFPLALLSHKFGNWVMGWAFRSNCTRGRK